MCVCRFYKGNDVNIFLGNNFFFNRRGKGKSGNSGL